MWPKHNCQIHLRLTVLKTHWLSSCVFHAKAQPQNIIGDTRKIKYIQLFCNKNRRIELHQITHFILSVFFLHFPCIIFFGKYFCHFISTKFMIYWHWLWKKNVCLWSFEQITQILIIISYCRKTMTWFAIQTLNVKNIHKT